MDYSGFPLYYRAYKKICGACARIRDVAINVLLAGTVAFLLFSYIFGYKVMFIMSESMEPLIRTHQLVLGHKVTEGTELSVGDICTYTPEGRDITITHRIIGRDGDGYVFKGDNNSYQDRDVVTRDQILYRLVLY